MGIKYFYTWIKNNFKDSIFNEIKEPIDVLAIDMNGLFHSSVAKLYKNTYNKNYIINYNQIPKNNLNLFKEICNKIEQIKNTIKPKKKLLLCVDGVAGLGKINLQRQRRFKNSFENDSVFDLNNFTPGTKLMDFLTKYIDWYIRNMITFNPDWQNLEIIFSNEKVQGEGEHKIIQFIKKNIIPSDNICIYGSDADIILLSLISSHQQIYIYRTNKNDYIEYVNIKLLKIKLLEFLKWEQEFLNVDEPVFNSSNTIYDFVFLTFLLGNDFLPSINSLNIYDGCLDSIINIYKENSKKKGNLINKTTTGNLYINPSSLAHFFELLSKQEINFIEEKYNSQKSFFPDPLIIKNMSLQDDKFIINYDLYKTEYYKNKFDSVNFNLDDIIKNYLDGMLWTLIYYDRGIPDWTWFYSYYYAPLLTDFSNYLVNKYKHPRFKLNDIITPYLQLLLILPPSSAQLVPEPLSTLINPSSVLGKYYPKNIEIDLTGKDKEWEGIIKLPTIQLNDFKTHYDLLVNNIQAIEQKRNINGKNFIYKYDLSKTNVFTSFYGSIPNCPISITNF
jgi:5'-3' exonuclease